MYIDFHLERCVLVQTAELYSPGKYMNWNLILSIVGLYLFSYGEFFKVTCAAVYELYRSNLICTFIPFLKCVLWSKQHSCTALQVSELEFEFHQWWAYVSYGELFKVPCATVHELYRSNLVCTLIPIWKGVFWSKQYSCTALASI